MKQLIYISSFALFTLAATSCSNNNEPYKDQVDSTMTVKEVAFKNAVTSYVNNTIIPTYKGMADNAIKMSEACNAIREAYENGTLTSTIVRNAGEYWNASRDFWEKSEAFLYGAAADYNIDPHIDSWPLDKNAMDSLLEDLRTGKDWSIDNNAGYGLLGFHSVEYMLFELSDDGNTSLTHNLNYTEEELVYLCAVAQDLRNQCILLEASWAGIDNVEPLKQEILAEAELSPSIDYGYSMMNAGQGGSLYKTYQAAVEDIVQGCIDIADEVGNTKIGRPVVGSSADDRNYIESPYSLNSINDFVGNIISIRNAYCGSLNGDASVSDYIKSVNPELDDEMRRMIETSIQAISAIPEPFAKTASTHPAAADAMEVVGTDLVNVLEKVMSEVSKL